MARRILSKGCHVGSIPIPASLRHGEVGHVVKPSGLIIRRFPARGLVGSTPTFSAPKLLKTVICLNWLESLALARGDEESAGKARILTAT
jgi:hypothetical protein